MLLLNAHQTRRRVTGSRLVNRLPAGRQVQFEVVGTAAAAARCHAAASSISNTAFITATAAAATGRYGSQVRRAVTAQQQKSAGVDRLRRGSRPAVSRDRAGTTHVADVATRCATTRRTAGRRRGLDAVGVARRGRRAALGDHVQHAVLDAAGCQQVLATGRRQRRHSNDVVVVVVVVACPVSAGVVVVPRYRQRARPLPRADARRRLVDRRRRSSSSCTVNTATSGRLLVAAPVERLRAFAQFRIVQDVLGSTSNLALSPPAQRYT